MILAGDVGGTKVDLALRIKGPLNCCWTMDYG
jgi:glucokinase